MTDDPETERLFTLWETECRASFERRRDQERAKMSQNSASSDDGKRDTPWLIAVSNTNCERRAALGLEVAGFEVWWPTRVVEIWRGGRATPRRRIEQTFPLFPGYLFTRRRTAAGWQHMIGVDGVRAVLCNNGEPVCLRQAGKGGMDELRAITDALSATTPKQPEFVIGGKVVVTNGPFLGQGGLLTRLLGSGAYEVEIGALGRLMVQPEQMEAVS